MNPIPNIKKSARIPELDGLRGLAILIVVFYHYVFGGFSPDDKSALAVSVHYISALAWSGVDLFFVLSGFLIGGILIDQREAKSYFKTFYIRRACRILPLYFLWLILFILLFFLSSRCIYPEWFGSLFDQQGIPLWLYAFFLQNFHVAHNGFLGSTWLGATWSLAIEEQFYLIMPFIIWLVPPRKLLCLLIGMILLVPIFRVYIYLYHTNIFQHVFSPCRADSLLLGILCALILRNDQARIWLETNQQRLAEIFLALLLGVAYLTYLATGNGIFFVVNLFEVIAWGYTWLACFFACLLLIAVTAQKGIIASIMRLPMLRNLGTISYGVYLIHMPINIIAHGLMGKEQNIKSFSDGMVTFAAFVATILLAAFSWRFFEKPIIAWGHSFSYSDNHIHPAK